MFMNCVELGISDNFQEVRIHTSGNFNLQFPPSFLEKWKHGQ